eukprot:219280-Rhodomonas_salina.1
MRVDSSSRGYRTSTSAPKIVFPVVKHAEKLGWKDKAQNASMSLSFFVNMEAGNYANADTDATLFAYTGMDEGGTRYVLNVQRDTSEEEGHAAVLCTLRDDESSLKYVATAMNYVR